MSVLLKKIVWYRVTEPTVPIIITDSIDMSLGRGIDIKNNILSLMLKNPNQSLNSSGALITEYVDNTGVIKFEEQDQLKVYLKYTDDMADVESNAWSDSTTEFPTNTHLKGVYYLIEFRVETNIKGNPIKLTCADKCYILFSKLLARPFLASAGISAPKVVQKVVRFASQNQDGVYTGTGEEPNVKYDVDARLEDEEGGYIQDVRKNTTEKGGVNSDLTFPNVAMAKVWKPVYEWVNELSQIEYLNTADELSDVSDIVYGRPFLYYVDEQNRFHWFETDNVVSETIVIGTTTGIHNYKLDKKVFDTVNFIIFRGGEDFYGKGTLDYYVEETSNIKTQRMRVIAMTEIAKNLIQAEIANGNLVTGGAGAFNFSGTSYDRNGSVTPAWNTTEYTTDDSYNTALRTQILKEGETKCRSLVKGLANARYKGTIPRKGAIVTVGSLLNITNTQAGQVSELLRVIDVRDTVNKSGWFTNMEVEQDQDAIIEMNN